PQPKILWGIFDAVVILRYPALGRDHLNAAGMGVLVDTRIVDVAEADGLGELLDLILVAGQKVPPLLGARRMPAVSPQINFLDLPGDVGSFVGIDAYAHHIEIP